MEDNQVTFTVLRRENVEHGVVFTVFADNAEGFSAFLAKHLDAAVPGTTVDIADLRTVFRLRHDGNWEVLRSYADSEDEETAAAIDAATEQLLDELLGEEEEEAST